MNVSKITALAYLAAEDSARCDGKQIIVLRQLRSELSKSPETQSRLACEFLLMACKAIEKRENSERLAFLGTLFTARLADSDVPCVSIHVRNLVILAFESMPALPRSGLAQTLTCGLECLRRLDPEKFSTLLAEFTRHIGDDLADPRLQILSAVVAPSERKMPRIRKMRYEVNRRQLERERLLKSRVN